MKILCKDRIFVDRYISVFSIYTRKQNACMHTYLCVFCENLKHLEYYFFLKSEADFFPNI